MAGHMTGHTVGYISNGLARTFWSDGSVGHYGEVTNHLMTRHLMGYKHKTYGGHITGYIYNGLVRRLFWGGNFGPYPLNSALHCSPPLLLLHQVICRYISTAGAMERNKLVGHLLCFI